MVLLIDNYDSFSYNLYQMIGAIQPNIQVIRNDEMTVEEIANLAPDHIILSPGPGRPEDAGLCMEVVKAFAGEIPILGVCLGHQAICETYGTTITYAKQLMHGKQDKINIKVENGIFKGLPHVIQGARYHSLAADPKTLSPQLEVTAETDAGEIMAIRHREYPVYGLQFHPESILTPKGYMILRNFLGGNTND